MVRAKPSSVVAGSVPQRVTSQRDPSGGGFNSKCRWARWSVSRRVEYRHSIPTKDPLRPSAAVARYLTTTMSSASQASTSPATDQPGFDSSSILDASRSELTEIWSPVKAKAPQSSSSGEQRRWSTIPHPSPHRDDACQRDQPDSDGCRDSPIPDRVASWPV